MAMSKGLKLALIIAVPTVVVGIVGVIIYYGNKKRDAQLQDLIDKNKVNDDGTVTYVDKDGNTVTKPKNQLSVNDIIATSDKAIDLGVKIADLFKTAPKPPTTVAP